MKLIIEIPEEMTEALNNGSFGVRYNAYDICGCVMNGTPIPDNATVCDIDAIRAEIIDKYITATGEVNTVAKGCLQIIDKYTKGANHESHEADD